MNSTRKNALSRVVGAPYFSPNNGAITNGIEPDIARRIVDIVNQNDYNAFIAQTPASYSGLGLSTRMTLHAGSGFVNYSQLEWRPEVVQFAFHAEGFDDMKLSFHTSNLSLTTWGYCSYEGVETIMFALWFEWNRMLSNPSSHVPALVRSIVERIASHPTGGVTFYERQTKAILRILTLLRGRAQQILQHLVPLDILHQAAITAALPRDPVDIANELDDAARETRLAAARKLEKGLFSGKKSNVGTLMRMKGREIGNAITKRIHRRSRSSEGNL